MIVSRVSSLNTLRQFRQKKEGGNVRGSWCTCMHGDEGWWHIVVNISIGCGWLDFELVFDFMSKFCITILSPCLTLIWRHRATLNYSPISYWIISDMAYLQRNLITLWSMMWRHDVSAMWSALSLMSYPGFPQSCVISAFYVWVCRDWGIRANV